MKLLASLFGASASAFTEWTVIVLIALAIFATGYLKGSIAERNSIAHEQLDIALAYAGEITRHQGIAEQLASDNEALRAAQAPRDRIITREVIRYAQTVPAAQRCTLPGTFRLLHDAAATGTPADPGPGSLADAAATPVEDASVIETVNDNYANCRDAIAKIDAWQRRWQKLESAP